MQLTVPGRKKSSMPHLRPITQYEYKQTQGLNREYYFRRPANKGKGRWTPISQATFATQGEMAPTRKPSLHESQNMRKGHRQFMSRVHIARVQTQVHPDTSMSGQAYNLINNFLASVAHNLVNHAIELARPTMRNTRRRGANNNKTLPGSGAVAPRQFSRHTQSGAPRALCKPGARACATKTISMQHIQAAVRLMLPNELSQHAVSEGKKAIQYYNKSLAAKGQNGAAWQVGMPKARSVPRGTRAQLVFSVANAESAIRAQTGDMRVGGRAPVYLTAVLEYLTAEVCELGGNQTRDAKRTRMTDQHIMQGIRNDSELNHLWGML
jgi:histone H2A